MENLNLPPFWIGQRVVCIKAHSLAKLELNKEYKVRDIKKGFCSHSSWRIDVGVTVPDCFGNSLLRCGRCDATIEVNDNVWWFGAPLFAPIEERFISFAEVIAIESQLIGAN